jgi:hypothetical protein
VVLVHSIRIRIAAVPENELDINAVGRAITIDEVLALAPHCDSLTATARRPDDGALIISPGRCAGDFPAKGLILGLAESQEDVLHCIEAAAAGYVLRDDSVVRRWRNSAVPTRVPR